MVQSAVANSWSSHRPACQRRPYDFEKLRGDQTNSRQPGPEPHATSHEK